MKVLYTAPNRGHHYHYSAALDREGMLHKFVSGFSRFSPRAADSQFGEKIHRVDFIQNLYLLSLKLRLPRAWCDHLAFEAKKEQDRVCSKYVGDADIFIFYNGSGLSSCRKAKKTHTITIVEAVNTHVNFQENLLREEYARLKLPWRPFHPKEKARRIMEYNLADYILVPSEFVKQSFMKHGFPAEKLIKVPYGFNKHKAGKQRTRKSGDPITILYVGSISVRKGLVYLIEAFKRLNYPKKKLIIVGPKNKVTGLAHMEMPEDIEFAGVLKGADLDEAYKRSDVFCLPSIEEGLALVLGEALSYGMPIITTSNTGAEDIIEDGKEGFIVPIRDSAAIAKRLNQLIGDHALYEIMRSNSLHKASILNGWENAGRLLCSSIRKAHGNHDTTS